MTAPNAAKVLRFPVREGMQVVCVRGNSPVGDVGGVWCDCATGCRAESPPVHLCAGCCGALVTSADAWCLACAAYGAP